MFQPAIFISLDLKNWWTWPQDVTFSIMYQIPKIEGKVESISGLIFNIHNRSALDFIRLWSGLYHQLYAAYHMHIKCREPARISSNFRPSKTFRVNKEADFIDEVKGQMLTSNHKNHSKHWLWVVLVQLGAGVGLSQPIEVVFVAFFIWKFTEYNLHINKSIHLYNLYYTHIKNNVGWKEKIDF